MPHTSIGSLAEKIQSILTVQLEGRDVTRVFHRPSAYFLMSSRRANVPLSFTVLLYVLHLLGLLWGTKERYLIGFHLASRGDESFYPVCLLIPRNDQHLTMEQKHDLEWLAGIPNSYSA